MVFHRHFHQSGDGHKRVVSMDEEQTAREQQILALMGHRLRVTLSDRRTVYGKLNCVDSALNLIMVDNEILLPSGATMVAKTKSLPYSFSSQPYHLPVLRMQLFRID